MQVNTGILGIALVAYFVVNTLVFVFPAAALAKDKGRHPFDAVVMNMIFGLVGFLYYVGIPISEEMEEQRQKKQAELIASAIRDWEIRN